MLRTVGYSPITTEAEVIYRRKNERVLAVAETGGSPEPEGDWHPPSIMFGLYRDGGETVIREDRLLRDVLEAYDRFYGMHPYHYMAGKTSYLDDSDTWEAVARWARIFHDAEVVVDTYTGYSQGDEWLMVSVVTPEWREETGFTGEATPKNVHPMEWVNWARGDVWYLVHEFHDDVDCEDSDDCEDDGCGAWAEVDSVHGFYEEYAEDCRYGLEHFDLQYATAGDMAARV